MAYSRIHLLFQIMYIRNGIRRFQMGLRVTGPADMKVSLTFDKFHQFIGILKIMLLRNIGIHISPQRKNVFNSGILKLL